MDDHTPLAATDDGPDPAQPAPRPPRCATLPIQWALMAETVPNASARLVLVALAAHADRFGVTTVGQPRLARMTLLSERTVRNALAALEGSGLILRVSRATALGGRTSNATILTGWPDRALLPPQGHPRFGRRVAENPTTQRAHALRAYTRRQSLQGDPATIAAKALNPEGTYLYSREEDMALAAALAALAPHVTDADVQALTEARATLHDWQRRGVDIERDLVPILRDRAQSGRLPAALNSWMYFAWAVEPRLARGQATGARDAAQSRPHPRSAGQTGAERQDRRPAGPPMDDMPDRDIDRLLRGSVKAPAVRRPWQDDE